MIIFTTTKIFTPIYAQTPKTTSDNIDFKHLIAELDDDLNGRYGELIVLFPRTPPPSTDGGGVRKYISTANRDFVHCQS